MNILNNIIKDKEQKEYCCRPTVFNVPNRLMGVK